MQRLDALGSTRLRPEAMHLACKAFAEGHLWAADTAALYILIRSAPAKRRAATGAAALHEIQSEFAGSQSKLTGTNGRAWLYFTLRLLEGTRPDAKTLARVRALREQAEALRRENHYARPMKELVEAADRVLSKD